MRGNSETVQLMIGSAAMALCAAVAFIGFQYRAAQDVNGSPAEAVRAALPPTVAERTRYVDSLNYVLGHVEGRDDTWFVRAAGQQATTLVAYPPISLPYLPSCAYALAQMPGAAEDMRAHGFESISFALGTSTRTCRL